ncbi:MAG TPA: DUF2341 domain-containing protein, partial [Bacillota bacterium]|nr:DUF2341 domain-containing protein [Bacillota bacterium]
MGVYKKLTRLARISILPLVLASVLILLGVGQAQAALYNTHYYKKITIDHTKVSNTDQTNFPVLISLTGLSHINTDGSDVRFTAGDGVTELPREIDSYSGGSLTAWVKVPSLSATVDTVVYMYYGDPSLTEPEANSAYGKNSVWDSNFKVVYHMNNASAATVSDSTANGQTGLKAVGGSTEISGAIGKAQSFDGIDDVISMPQKSLTGPTTFQGIIKRNVTGTRQHILSNNLPGVGTNQRLFINGDNARYDMFNGAPTQTQNLVVGTTVLGTTDYYYMTGVYDGSSVNIYVNGQLETSKTVYAPPDNIDSNYFIGAYQTGSGTYGEFVNGNIDEVRMSDTARSADWIRTEYTNQSNPGAFYAVGTETAVSDSVPPALINATRSGGSIILNYTEELNATSIPAKEDFAVTVNGTAREISVVNISGNQVIIGVATSITGVDTVIVSYSSLGTLKDLTGNSASGFTDTSVGSGVGIYNAHYYRKISIDHNKVSSNQTNFPVLISLSGLSHISANGADVRFTASDGITELPREIESYSGGNLTAWVKVPTLSSTVDTIVYMYYGDTTLIEPAADSPYGKQAVWDSNYKMVQHMSDATSTTVSDSTVNNNTGDKKNGVAQVAAKIGNGQQLSAANHYIDYGNKSSLKFGSGNFTYSSWINLNSWDPVAGNTWRNYIMAVTGAGDPEGWTTLSAGWYFRVVRNTDTSPDGYFMFAAGTGLTGTGTPVGSFATYGGVNLNTWYFITLEVDGNYQRLFVNGTKVAELTLPSSKTFDRSNIYSGASENDYSASAVQDEVRLSNSARSADWIKTEYNNQSNLGTFYLTSPEFTLADTIPPTVMNIRRNGTTLVLNFNEGLDSMSVPDAVYFGVKENGVSKTINNVSISANQLTLTLASSVDRMAPVTVDFTPGTTPLKDLSGNEAASFTNKLVDLGQNVYFSDDAENGTQMIVSGTWNATTEKPFTYSKSWSDSPGGNSATATNWDWFGNRTNFYKNIPIHSNTLTTPTIDLSGSINPELSFFQQYDMLTGVRSQTGIVLVSSDGGANWSELGTYTGTNTVWNRVYFNLSAFKTSNVKIRFVYANWMGNAKDGWYIDTIRVGEPGLGVSSTNPIDSATQVPTSGPFTITFDKFMNNSTINSDTLIVKKGDGTPLTGIVTSDGLTASFKPTGDRAYGELYTATVTQGVYSSDGFTLLYPFTWQFRVMGPDTVAPTGTVKINNDNTSTRLTNVTLNLSATDDNSGVSYMRFSNTTDFTSANWIPYATTANWTLLPGNGTKTVYVQYKDYAGNTSPGDNTANNDAISYNSNTTYYSDDAEGATQLTPTSPWGKVNISAHSGQYAWADSPDGNYQKNINYQYVTFYNGTDPAPPNTGYFTIPSRVPSTTLTTPLIDLSQATRPYLSFWQRYDLENGTGNSRAFGVVQISTDGGNYWAELADYTGAQTTWQMANLDLSAYKSSTVKVRFFIASYSGAAKDGWYVDDIRVGESAPSVVTKNISDGATNVPAGGAVTVTFDTAIDPASVNSDTFMVKKGSVSIPGTYTVTNNMISYIPNNTLDYSTNFTASITTGVTSLAGFPLDVPISWQFTTAGPDNTSPAASITVNSDVSETNSLFVNLSMNATDDNSGVKYMQISNTDGDWDNVPKWLYAPTYLWRLTPGDGVKTVYLRVYDVAGNVSAVAYDSISYDSFGIDPVNLWTVSKQATITGPVEAGSTVSVTSDSLMAPGIATVSGDRWSYTILDLTSGANNITVTATKGAISKTRNVTINFMPYFSDYMEGTPRMFGYNGWARVKSTVNSGVYSWADSPYGDYVNWTRSWLVTDLFSIARAAKPTLYYNYKSALNTGDLIDIQYDDNGNYSFSGLGPSGQITTNKPTWTEGKNSLGTNARRIKFRFTSDGSGNADGIYLDDVVIAEESDQTAPFNPSILVNNNAPTAMSTSVTLNLSALDNTPAVNNLLPNSMQFSDDGVNWTDWEDYSDTKSWNLTWGSGTKYVYARFKDGSGNVSAKVFDTIELDVSSPVVTILPGVNTVTQNVYNISFTVFDDNAVTVRITPDTVATVKTPTITTIDAKTKRYDYTITQLEKEYNNFTILATDNGGNATTVQASVFLDVTGDSVGPDLPASLNVVGNTVYGTKSLNVTLKPNASDAGTGVTWMEFVNINSASEFVPDNTWETVGQTVYASTYSWKLADLGPNSDGYRYVAGRYFDAAGNVSQTVYGSIYYDATPPLLSIGSFTTPINAMGQLLNNWSVLDHYGVTISVASSTRDLSGSFATATVTGSAPNQTWTYNIPSDTTNGPTKGLIFGDNTYTFTATDQVGNSSSKSIVINSGYSWLWNDGTDMTPNMIRSG